MVNVPVTHKSPGGYLVGSRGDHDLAGFGLWRYQQCARVPLSLCPMRAGPSATPQRGSSRAPEGRSRWGTQQLSGTQPKTSSASHGGSLEMLGLGVQGHAQHTSGGVTPDPPWMPEGKSSSGSRLAASSQLCRRSHLGLGPFTSTVILGTVVSISETRQLIQKDAKGRKRWKLTGLWGERTSFFPPNILCASL